jgi:hypothetical protein
MDEEQFTRMLLMMEAIRLALMLSAQAYFDGTWSMERERESDRTAGKSLNFR